MKTILIATLMAAFIHSANNTDEMVGEEKNIHKVIKLFSKAGDTRDLIALDKVLDDNYRIVMNQLFGSEEISTMDKATYLSMIKSEKFGGDDRRVEIKETLINGKNAVCIVNLWGKAMNVRSTLSLIKDASETWRIVSDTPEIITEKE